MVLELPLKSESVPPVMRTKPPDVSDEGARGMGAEWRLDGSRWLLELGCRDVSFEPDLSDRMFFFESETVVPRCWLVPTEADAAVAAGALGPRPS